MDKKDLLHHCRYYKGEDNIKTTDPDKQTFCKIEKEWVELTLSNKKEQPDILSDVLNEYILAKMREFEQYDDTPITLKALLFNRFIKYNERYDIETFKKWYRDKYIG